MLFHPSLPRPNQSSHWTRATYCSIPNSYPQVQLCSTQLLNQYKRQLKALESKLDAIERRAGSKTYPKVKFRSYGDRKRILVSCVVSLLQLRTCNFCMSIISEVS